MKSMLIQKKESYMLNKFFSILMNKLAIGLLNYSEVENLLRLVKNATMGFASSLRQIFEVSNLAYQKLMCWPQQRKATQN